MAPLQAQKAPAKALFLALGYQPVMTGTVLLGSLGLALVLATAAVGWGAGVLVGFVATALLQVLMGCLQLLQALDR